MGKFVLSRRMNFPRTNQTNKVGGKMSKHEFTSFWFYREVTKSEDIQATQQLNFTKELGEKLNLNQKSSLGKPNKIKNTKCHGSMTFLGLYTMKKTTPWSAKFAFLFPKLLTNLAPCSLETVPLGVLPFRPMLKVKLTSSVMKQTLLGKTQVPHLWQQCYEIWMPGYEYTCQRKTAKAFQQCPFKSKVSTAV